MIQFKRLDHFHICVPAERLEEALKFYTEVIGLQQVERPNHIFTTIGYWFDIGNVQLHIGVEPTLPRTIRHTAMEVVDAAAARQLLEKYGVEIAEEPEVPQRTRFAFIDPFGNRMELLQIGV